MLQCELGRFPIVNQIKLEEDLWITETISRSVRCAEKGRIRGEVKALRRVP